MGFGEVWWGLMEFGRHMQTHALTTLSHTDMYTLTYSSPLPSVSSQPLTISLLKCLLNIKVQLPGSLNLRV